MKINLNKTLGTILAVAGLAMALPAHANVTFTVDGWGPTSFPGPTPPPATASHVLDGQGYPGDTVGLQAGGGSFDLAPGAFVQKINTLNWTVDWTYAGAGDPLDPDAGWQQLSFTVNASRDVTIGSQTVTLYQTGLLEVNWDNDYLSFSAGPTATIYLDGYKIDITPLGVARTGAVFPAGPPWVQPDQDMMAQFDITEVPVPEPTTMIAGALLLLPFGASTLRILRKRQTA